MHARELKFCTANISLFLLFRVEKYFMIFNFVVLSDYENNISTMKISGFTVLICTCTHIHTDGKIDEKRSATDYRGYTLVDPIPSHYT